MTAPVCLTRSRCSSSVPSPTPLAHPAPRQGSRQLVSGRYREQRAVSILSESCVRENCLLPPPGSASLSRRVLRKCGEMARGSGCPYSVPPSVERTPLPQTRVNLCSHTARSFQGRGDMLLVVACSPWITSDTKPFFPVRVGDAGFFALNPYPGPIFLSCCLLVLADSERLFL